MKQTSLSQSLPILPLLMLLLAGCGGSSSFPSTAIYGAADSSHLVFASWQQDAGTPDLHGKWETWTATFRRDMTDASGPQSESRTLSGEISKEDQTATLSVNGSVLTARPSGDHLNLIGSIAFATFQPAVLQSFPSPQVKNELTTAFSRAIVARKHLYTLRVILNEKPTPQDSAPVAYAGTVQYAESYVQRLQMRHDQLMNLNNPCGTVDLMWWNLEYSPDESIFKLSNEEVAQHTPEQNAQVIANASSLGQSLQQVQQDWQDVKTAHIPQIPGLSYDWQVSGPDEEQAIKLAQERKSTLQGLLVTDGQTMSKLKQQTRQLATDVKNKAEENGCQANGESL